MQIAADAGQWLKCHTPEGHKAYGIPSQATPNLYYLANRECCTCPDFKERQQPCKHVLAVRIHCDRTKVQRAPLSPETVRLARRYDAIFGTDE